MLTLSSKAPRFPQLVALLCCAMALTSGLAQAPAQGSARGADLFRDKGCEYCHGVNGVSGGKGPSLASVGRTLKPAEIEKQIREGGGAMPAFGDTLQPDEVSALVDYLKTKRQKPPRQSKAKQPKAAAQKTTPGNTGGSDDQ